jgi:2,4-dienoyl-CoA reductase-like NADH-dependent reductase (Old Yellow Enzyme family)
MPLGETLETFSALINEAVRMGIAYVQLVRCTDPDPEQPNPGTFHEVLESYGPLVKRPGSTTLLVLNGGVKPEEADMLIRHSQVDAVAFGEAWINNPDLQMRIEAGIPLATELNEFALYNFEDDLGVGYTDYPTAS